MCVAPRSSLSLDTQLVCTSFLEVKLDMTMEILLFRLTLTSGWCAPQHWFFQLSLLPSFYILPVCWIWLCGTQIPANLLMDHVCICTCPLALACLCGRHVVLSKWLFMQAITAWNCLAIVNPSTHALTVLIFLFAISTSACFSVGVLFCWHVYLVLTAQVRGQSEDICFTHQSGMILKVH